MQLIHRCVVSKVLVLTHLVVGCNLIQGVFPAELSVGSKGLGIHELWRKGLLVLRDKVLLVALGVIPVTGFKVVPHVLVNSSDFHLAIPSSELVGI